MRDGLITNHIGSVVNLYNEPSWFNGGSGLVLDELDEAPINDLLSPFQAIGGVFMKRAALVAVVCLALSGCVSTSTTMLSGGPVLPPTADSAIVIYRTASQVPGPYRELALLNSSGDASMTNVSQMYASMRTEAAKIGANAIILDATTEPGAGAQVAAAIFGVSANRSGRAIAILVEGLPSIPAPPKPTKN